MSDIDLNFLRPDKAPGMGVGTQQDSTFVVSVTSGNPAADTSNILRSDAAPGMGAGFEEDGATVVTVYLHLLIITSGSVYGDSGGASGGLA